MRDISTHLGRCLFVTVAIALAAQACGSADSGGKSKRTGPSVSFATFNAGLARGFVDHAEQRLDPVAEAVGGVDADALCLQEIWLVQNDQKEWSTSQIERVESEAEASFPHSYTELTRQEGGGGAPACSASELEPLKTCVEANCADVGPDGLLGCAQSKCGMEVSDLSNDSPDCFNCLAQNIGQPLDQITRTCRSSGGGGYTYGGHNGLMLLSKHALESTEHTKLTSTLVQRSVLHATISPPDAEPVDLYCTHLAADLSETVPYSGDEFDSYAEEQAAQIDELIAWIEQTAVSGRIVLMGDMNTGPATKGLEGALPDNYATFPDEGFSNPYLSQESPSCTTCRSNLLKDAEGSGGPAIDHVLFRFPSAPDVATTERILDEPVTITTSDGSDQRVHLSDHFGVRTVVRGR